MLMPAQPRPSFAALALMVSLALPAGVLTLLSSPSTAEQVDASDSAVVGRAVSTQFVSGEFRTIVSVEIEELIVGVRNSSPILVAFEGKSPMRVGDRAVLLLPADGMNVLGTYQLRKDDDSLEYHVTTPITGMAAQGILGSGPVVTLERFAAAIQERKGSGQQDPGGGGGIDLLTGVLPDANEPNDTLVDATPIDLPPPHLLTGLPLVLSGLTLTRNDVDFYSFNAGPLSLLHATTLDAGTGQLPDTLIGVFDAGSGQLLAWDDDGGPGSLSLLVVPLETIGPYAVAVESAPDTEPDFTGAEGSTVGDYGLSLELEQGSYLWNGNVATMIMGVSPDGTFIEDLIGFKDVGDKNDVLLAGVPADGWALNYDIHPLSGDVHVYGGAGDQLSGPLGFTHSLVPLSFELGGFQDGNGLNRRGLARASSIVASSLSPTRGVGVTTQYTVSLHSRTVVGDTAILVGTGAPTSDILYTRVLDVDLFGAGDDHFYWSFDPASPVKAFAVDSSTHVGNVSVPGLSVGDSIGDMQVALIIDRGDVHGGNHGEAAHFKTGFTFTNGHASELDALLDAQVKLANIGLTTWVVAIDEDDATSTFSAFGSGLGL